MVAPTLRKHTLADIKKHNSAKSCWIIHNDKVYDVTEFVADHPGGDDLILNRAGQDVTGVMKDPLEHDHSESAYEILDDYRIGVVDRGEKIPTDYGALGVEGLKQRPAKPDTTVECEDSAVFANDDFRPSLTDASLDYQRTHFLDLTRPLFPQMLHSTYSKEFYLKQVHHPRHIVGSAPIFGPWYLEIFSKTPWWVVPILWLPWVGYNLWRGSEIIGVQKTATGFGIGVFIWTLLEYGLHRFLFHVDDWMPDNKWCLIAHFFLHGIHHYIPMDRMRLVMPPALHITISGPLVVFAHKVIASGHAQAVIAGAFFGYVLYDLTHYYLHHARVLEFHFKEMKKYHMAHHYKNYESGYGITSKIWDYVFGTMLYYE
ncbi:hypothetical protein BC938DRAFT_473084 [Jimgerdemannia flammicorona]|uniref:Ceramide very long chain fatty acid hydroxylase n=1 Tax=Jimgerdemannia flammicorona TaxID=994334 RepID=A0A433Q4W8_9FUNG|nr:hypothetical protein BC938DRAFT_473084 [Jimgerdemannia flammicorona]